MKGAGQIDFNRFRLVEAVMRKDKLIVDFEAPRLGGHTFEEWRSVSNVLFTTPHEDLITAWLPIRRIILRLFDWPDGRIDQVRVTGIRMEHSAEEFEVSFRFIFSPSKIAGEMELSKTLPLTSIHGLSSSLTEDELDHITDLIEEIRAYVAREKSADGDLFDGKAVVDLHKN